MNELNVEEMKVIGGGYWDWGNIAYSIGYNVGSAGGYFYNNVLIGNGIIDDIASIMAE